MENDYLTQGIAAQKAGNKQEARRLLKQAVQQNPNDERCWSWLYNVSENDNERLKCITEVLRVNPKNEKARDLLQVVSTRLVNLDSNNQTQMIETERIDQEGLISTSKATKKKNHLWIYMIGGIALLCILMVAILIELYISKNGNLLAASLQTNTISSDSNVGSPPIAATISITMTYGAPASSPIPLPTNTPSFTNTPELTNTPRPTATPIRGTMGSPYLYGEEVSLRYTLNGQISDYTLQVLDVIRGDEANSIIHTANMFNDEPPAGASWMLFKVRVTLVGGAAFSLAKYDLAVISGGQFFAGVSFGACCTEDIGYPELDANIASPGTSVEGWGIRPVLLIDEKPLLALNINEYSPDMDEGIFFALYK